MEFQRKHGCSTRTRTLDLIRFGTRGGLTFTAKVLKCLSLLVLLAGVAGAQACQITSPLPIPITIQGCTYSTSVSSLTVSTLTVTSSMTVQNITINGTCTGSGCGTSGGGYALEPSTITPNLAKGFLASTGTVTYNLNVGSMTGAGLTSCSGTSNAVSWNNATSLFGCNTITGSGGGASTLAVQQNAVNITSPTVAINFVSPPFKVAQVNGSTSQVTLDGSSVTLQGTVTAASLGALTANQSITLSGDASGTGTTAITVTNAASQPNITTLSHTLTVSGASTTFTNVVQSTAIYVSSATIGTDEYSNGSYVATSTISWANGNMQKVTLTANTTFLFNAPAHPGTLTLRLLTGSGSFTAAWPGTVKWSGGTAPTITVTASKSDFVVCKYASDGNYYCSASGTQNF